MKLLRIVEVKIDEESLTEMQKTGGKYFRATDNA